MRVLAVTNIYPTEAHPGSGTFIAEQLQSDVDILFIERLTGGRQIYRKLGRMVRAAFDSEARRGARDVRGSDVGRRDEDDPRPSGARRLLWLRPARHQRGAWNGSPAVSESSPRSEWPCARQGLRTDWRPNIAWGGIRREGTCCSRRTGTSGEAIRTRGGRSGPPQSAGCRRGLCTLSKACPTNRSHCG